MDHDDSYPEGMWWGWTDEAMTEHSAAELVDA